MSKKILPEMSSEDKAIIDQFNANYAPGVWILKRAKDPSANRAKTVNVYVDGILMNMPKDTLVNLIGIGWYIPIGGSGYEAEYPRIPG